METDYNFWRDLLDTYQSLPDWLKFCWLVIPAATVLAPGHLVKSGFQAKRRASTSPCEFEAPAYRGWCDEQGVLYLQQIEKLPSEPQLPLPLESTRKA